MYVYLYWVLTDGVICLTDPSATVTIEHPAFVSRPTQYSVLADDEEEEDYEDKTLLLLNYRGIHHFMYYIATSSSLPIHMVWNLEFDIYTEEIRINN